RASRTITNPTGWSMRATSTWVRTAATCTTTTARPAGRWATTRPRSPAWSARRANRWCRTTTTRSRSATGATSPCASSAATTRRGRRWPTRLRDSSCWRTTPTTTAYATCRAACPKRRCWRREMRSVRSPSPWSACSAATAMAPPPCSSGSSSPRLRVSGLRRPNCSACAPATPTESIHLPPAPDHTENPMFRTLLLASALAALCACGEAPSPAHTAGAGTEAGAPAADNTVSSLLGQPLVAPETLPNQDKLEADLAEALAQREANPDDPEALISVARRLGYLWRFNEAIAVLDEGIARWPDNPKLYRHRGHRYITVRDFASAQADFEKATQLIAGQPDEIEPDGQPNPAGIPRTTLAYNI